MSTLTDQVIAFLDHDEWPWEDGGSSGDATVLKTAFQGDNGRWVCAIVVREGEGQILFYSLLPEATPEDRLPAMYEAVARANEDLMLGNFEVASDDGTLRFKTSIDVGGQDLTPDLMRPVVLANVITTDQHLPALTAVQQGVPPVEALVSLD